MRTYLPQQDPELEGLIRLEEKRQQEGLLMIASENLASPAVLEAAGTVLTNKYAEGYPGKRYYTGNQYIDKIEQLAIDRAKELFGAEHANVQPHAGSQANLACYFALLEPGDTILAMNLAHGGHLTHGHPVSLSGKLFKFVHYGVQKDTEVLDMDEVEKLAMEVKPKMILSGFTAYPRAVPFSRFADIAKKVGAYAMADMSHIAGLVVGGVHESPVPTHDVVMTTTTKTLRGPRSAIILSKAIHAAKIDKAVFPGMQGGPLEHIIAAKAVCFKEAMTAEYKAYQQQVAKNAKALADELMAEGLRLVSGGTDTHLMIIDCTSLGISGKQGADALAECGIYTNFNMIPFDTRKPADPSGIRLGTPALTARGMKEPEMKTVGKLIADLLKNPTGEQKEKTKKAVIGLVKKI
ncbi:serine hydroxymethyltransferase [Candidatus Azambacteria bacterium RIFCSPLOWO2_01_FULL_46_25]|uniref:2-methylserine hydroxymethyltransferase n=1 Tax=Candidatus Azambacteria bacterium RIFCSPLOWO2_01_FULL_46_25 TaxID=1797298 RepID=A0A1F5BVA4_9BACT|nr:MAG: serine hydroxymethyltransferase [Candidatus Azambacteria bacterium RIFCSPLOWO2_01_FULL_46_25]OGD36411.1 MAG: serine hydroxymethyltransferase [Candidatus Azambacteria bacterium RIFCSPHIGHO2_01_FULL_51_74]